jgi:hypothetical protein
MSEAATSVGSSVEARRRGVSYLADSTVTGHDALRTG